MGFTFSKATKAQAKLRAAVFGPSGSGKTFTMLRIATGLGGRIAVVDTERGSASKYADRFDFDVLDLPEKDIATYCDAIAAAAKAGYGVLILDSLSHAWQELLAEIDRLAATKFKGNTWSAWSEGTPKQRQLVDAILDYPGHVLASMRSKTEWSQEKDDRGKTKPVRVGLAPEQGKGIEYEFDLLLEMSVDHLGTVLKDRTGKFQDKILDKPGEAFGRELEAWLSDGAAPVARTAPPAAAPSQPTPMQVDPVVARLQKRCQDAVRAGLVTAGAVKATIFQVGGDSLADLDDDALTRIDQWLADLEGLAAVAQSSPAAQPAPAKVAAVANDSPADEIAALEAKAGPERVNAARQRLRWTADHDPTTATPAMQNLYRRALAA